MAIFYRLNQSIGLNLVEYYDVISTDQLKALAAWAAGHPQHIRRDTLAVVKPGASFDVDLPVLDALFAHYRELYAPLEFEMLRRSAWICQSPAAQPYVDHWLKGDARTGMSTAVRQFADFAAAGEWLVLNKRETAATESGEGFVEIGRF